MFDAVTAKAGESFLNLLHLEPRIALWLYRKLTFHLGVTKMIPSLFQLQTLYILETDAQLLSLLLKNNNRFITCP